ncbi:MAG: hypothetical protein ICV66_11165 [Chitinophagaceae bacterium]|nr:hypothetical protein [Chitinophagaceae bacterium]
MLEYEEKIPAIFSRETAELLIGAFSLLNNVKKTEIQFNLNLITADPDDNKFFGRSGTAAEQRTRSWSLFRRPLAAILLLAIGFLLSALKVFHGCFEISHVLLFVL